MSPDTKTGWHLPINFCPTAHKWTYIGVVHGLHTWACYNPACSAIFQSYEEKFS